MSILSPYRGTIRCSKSIVLGDIFNFRRGLVYELEYYREQPYKLRIEIPVDSYSAISYFCEEGDKEIISHFDRVKRYKKEEWEK